MAGLLAANMLRRRDPIVYEVQRSLPHNHSAVLRFRSNLVGEVLGIPFKKVRVIKSVLPWRNPVADSMAYSHKVIGAYRTDRSVLPGTEVVERWIAPPNLIERMAEGVNVKYETDYDFSRERTKVISTIPMPNMMMVMGYQPMPNFGYVTGRNVRGRVPNCEAYLSVSVPDPTVEFSRASVTGDELIVELNHDILKLSSKKAEVIVMEACYYLGVQPEVREMEVLEQRYQKIAPIDEIERRRFIFWCSSVMGRAFSLGRYACWRPGLLMDDVVKDVRLIDGWIDSPTSGYEQDIHLGRRT